MGVVIICIFVSTNFFNKLISISIHKGFGYFGYDFMYDYLYFGVRVYMFRGCQIQLLILKSGGVSFATSPIYYCQVFHFQCLHIVAFSFCIHFLQVHVILTCVIHLLSTFNFQLCCCVRILASTFNYWFLVCALQFLAPLCKCFQLLCFTLTQVGEHALQIH